MLAIFSPPWRVAAPRTNTGHCGSIFIAKDHLRDRASRQGCCIREMESSERSPRNFAFLLSFPQEGKSHGHPNPPLYRPSIDKTSDSVESFRYSEAERPCRSTSFAPSHRSSSYHHPRSRCFESIQLKSFGASFVWKEKRERKREKRHDFHFLPRYRRISISLKSKASSSSTTRREREEGGSR